MSNTIFIDPVLNLSSQDYPNPSGWCIEIFVIGCDFNCKNCSNNSLQNNNGTIGVEITKEDLINKVLKVANINNIKYLSLLGGDPLALNNRKFIIDFCKDLHQHLDICVYTGYSIDVVKELEFYDFTFIKCGVFNIDKYIQPEKTDEYIQFASTNQKLYNNKHELLSQEGKYIFKEI